MGRQSDQTNGMHGLTTRENLPDVSELLGDPGSPIPVRRLADLRRLRSAPQLTEPERSQLRAELESVLSGCPWFTIGVMARSADEALACLRRCESALSWPALSAVDPAADLIEGPVFLKGNQRTGTYLLRREEGLGEGVLISGQHPDDPTLTDTWGPLPLDLF